MYGSSSSVIFITHSGDARRAPGSVVIKHTVSVVEVNTAAKRDKHAAGVEAVGDEFVAPAFTPSGTPYPSAIKFFRRIAHPGDKLDRSAGRDAPRFHHGCTASTFMTPTHVAFMVHMCAAATARASAKAARLYAHERATRHSLRANTLNRPVVIPAPF